MRASIPSSGFLWILVVVGVAAPDVRAHASKEALLRQAETRLRAIYDRDEFRAKRFRADWLSDSLGYTVLEPIPNANERALVRYDAASGERTVLEAPRRDESSRSGDISPDGRSVLYSEGGNLYVRELDGDRKIQLTDTTAGGSVSNSRAVWSPDGKRIAFVQSDGSKVKLRSVLVPGDPTYPSVREVRFARVGETISTVRVWMVLENTSESFP